MQPEVEIVSGLERRVDLVVTTAAIETAVKAQLKRVASTARIQGFRPGKAPLALIERSHGAGIRYDVLNEQIGSALEQVIRDADLRVAGTPEIEPDSDGSNETQMVFKATFEVYPEVELPDLAVLEVTRAQASVGDSEIDRTFEILRKQRARYEADAGRAAQDEDRVTLDFTGTIDGVAFEGGTATDFPFVLGQGRMLPEFETAVSGMKTGEEKTFPLTFPEDYGSEDVAGKTAEFTIKVTEVAAPVLPELDAEFARSLGQEEGDLEQLRTDVRTNIEREVKARVQARTKSSVMDALAKACTFDIPKALVKADIESRISDAREDLKQRGVPDAENVPIPEDAFKEASERRVRLGLVVAELVEKAELGPKPEQVRARIEEFAQNYEEPEQVIAYYLGDRERRAEIEAIVLEDNVVDHILSVAKVADEVVDFDEIMGTR
ncbi:MAG: trigger factor [Castellaniella sp.]